MSIPCSNALLMGANKRHALLYNMCVTDQMSIVDLQTDDTKSVPWTEGNARVRGEENSAMRRPTRTPADLPCMTSGTHSNSDFCHRRPSLGTYPHSLSGYIKLQSLIVFEIRCLAVTRASVRCTLPRFPLVQVPFYPSVTSLVISST